MNQKFVQNCALLCGGEVLPGAKKNRQVMAAKFSCLLCVFHAFIERFDDVGIH